MWRMQNVDKHPKSGVYRVRFSYPQHLCSILGARSVTRSLGTRDAGQARTLAIPVLASIQSRVKDAEQIYRAQQSGQAPALQLTLKEGLRLINQWRDAYLQRTANVISLGQGQAGDYWALGSTPAEDAKILSGDMHLMLGLYYSDLHVSNDIANRTLDRILVAAGYLLPENHPLRRALAANLQFVAASIRERESE